MSSEEMIVVYGLCIFSCMIEPQRNARESAIEVSPKEDPFLSRSRRFDSMSRRRCKYGDSYDVLDEHFMEKE